MLVSGAATIFEKDTCTGTGSASSAGPAVAPAAAEVVTPDEPTGWSSERRGWKRNRYDQWQSQGWQDGNDKHAVDCLTVPYGTDTSGESHSKGWLERAAKLSALARAEDLYGLGVTIDHYEERYQRFRKSLKRFEAKGVPADL